MDEEDNLQSPDTIDGRIDCNEESKSQLVGETQKDEKKKKDVSFREKLLKNPGYKDKFTYSMFMAVSFVALGMYMGQHGPTFMDLQIITDTDLETASALFTGGNAGYLTGSILVGLVYSKIPTPFLVFVMTLCLGIVNVFQPYCTQFEVMIVVRSVAAMFCGALNTGLNSEHMTLWGSDANSLLQFQHFSFSIGGVISPLFTEPFLAEKIGLQTTNNVTTNESAYNNATAAPQEFTKSRVEYVFLITGIFIIVTSFPFLVVYFKRSDKSKSTAKKRSVSQRYVPLPIQVVMLCGLCVFNLMYGCVEGNYFSFLMTFLVEGYDSVSKSKGAFVTAIGWAAYALARFLMIFMTKLFTTVQILSMLTTAMVISFASFAVFAHFGIVSALIVLSAIGSLAFSGVFPVGLAWTEQELFPVTGIISSCVFVSSSLGFMASPMVLGKLMGRYSNMWFCYLLLIETLVMYVMFIGLLVFRRCYVDKRYGTLSSRWHKTRDVELEVTNGLKLDLKHDGAETSCEA